MSLKAKLGCGAILIIPLILRFAVFSECFSDISGYASWTLWYDYFAVADANPVDRLYRYGEGYVFGNLADFDAADLKKEKQTFVNAVETSNNSFIELEKMIDNMFSSYRKQPDISPGLQTAYENLTADYGNLKKIEDAYGAAMLEYLEFATEHYGETGYDYELSLGKIGKEYSGKILSNMIEIEKKNEERAVAARATVAVLEKKVLAAFGVLKENINSLTDKIGYDFSVFAEELAKI